MHKSTPPQIRRQQYSSLEYSIRPNLGKPTQTNPLFSPNPPTKSTNSTPKTTQKRNQIVQTPTRPKNTTHPRNPPPPPPKTVGKHRRRIPAPVPLDSPRSGSAPAVESGLCAFACEGEGDEEKQRDKPYGESRAKQLRLKRKRS